MTTRNLDFPYLRTWNQMMGNSNTWTKSQLANARADKAPHDAIYERSVVCGAPRSHTWAVYSEITNQNTKKIIDRLMLERANAM